MFDALADELADKYVNTAASLGRSLTLDDASLGVVAARALKTLRRKINMSKLADYALTELALLRDLMRVAAAIANSDEVFEFRKNCLAKIDDQLANACWKPMIAQSSSVVTATVSGTKPSRPQAHRCLKNSGFYITASVFSR